jgi:methyl-accepting chemotaxis protein
VVEAVFFVLFPVSLFMLTTSTSTSTSTSTFSLSPRDWRIGTRLVLGFGLLIAMLFVMAAVSVARIGGLVETNRRIIEHEWVNADAANTLSSIAQANARRTIEIYFAANAAERAQKRADILAGREAFIKAFKTLQQQIDQPEGKQWLSEAEEARGRYVKSQAKFNEWVDTERKEQAFEELYQHTLPNLVIVQDRVDKLAQLQRRQVVESGAKAKAEAEADRLLMLVLGAVGLVTGLALATIITRSIIGPMREAVAVAQAVAAGDLSSQVRVHSRDEAGQLLQALHDMNDSLAAIVHEVRHSSDTIATASSQIAAGNLDLSSRTEQQAAALQQTTASMHELAGTVQQNCDSGRHANELAESASKVAQRGGQVV